MDPVSIAAAAAGVAVTCMKISGVLFTWVDETRHIDTNVSGFCEEILSLGRVLAALSKSIKENPLINAPGLDRNSELWSDFKATMDDCQTTLDTLSGKFDEIQTTAPFGLSILRRPMKRIRLSQNMKEIEVYRQRIQHYNGAMQLPLQMINVSVLLQNRAGQVKTDLEIVGLRKQVGRVEKRLRLRHDSQAMADDFRDENNPLFQNLMRLVRQAENFSSKASSIAGTIYGGSVLGNSLTRDQRASIENWIPPPIAEENSSDRQEDNLPSSASASAKTVPSSTAPRPQSSLTTDLAAEQSESDSDSELQREMTKKFKELAFGSFQRQELGKAEKLIGKVDKRLVKAARHGHPLDPAQKIFQIRLGIVYCLQEKWREAEDWLLPLTTTKVDKEVCNIEVFHGMHALALNRMKEKNYTLAIRHCKRATSGKRRIYGADNVSLFESISLLALLFEKAGDPTEAEAYRSFLSDSSPDLAPVVEEEPARYIEKAFGLDERVAEVDAELNNHSERYQNEIRRKEGTFESDTNNLTLPSDTRKKTPGSLSTWSRLLELEQSSAAASLLGSSPLSELSTARMAPNLKSDASTIFVGIDLGTVYTTVAVGLELGTETEFFVSPIINLGKEVDQAEHVQHIHTFSDYQIPTVLYYKQPYEVVGWGLDISAAITPTGYVRDDVQKGGWFKLLPLIDGNTFLTGIEYPELPPDRSEINVIADFLYKLRQAIIAHLRSSRVFHYGPESKIRYTIAIPAVYDDAKSKVLRLAATKAGYLDLDFVHRQKAALLKYRHSLALGITEGTMHLVVQCGSAFVELSTYYRPQNSASFAEYTQPTEDSCGFMDVAINFYSLLHAKTRKAKLPNRVKVTCGLDFFKRIGLEFNDDGRSWTTGLGLGTVEFLEADVKDGCITFTNKEILACFDPPVERIRQLVDRQLDVIKAGDGGIQEVSLYSDPTSMLKVPGHQNPPLKGVLISGDFSASEYLFRYLKEHLAKVAPTLTVIRGSRNEIPTAAAVGAVLEGHSRSKVRPRHVDD